MINNLYKDENLFVFQSIGTKALIGYDIYPLLSKDIVENILLNKKIFNQNEIQMGSGLFTYIPLYSLLLNLNMRIILSNGSNNLYLGLWNFTTDLVLLLKNLGAITVANKTFEIENFTVALSPYNTLILYSPNIFNIVFDYTYSYININGKILSFPKEIIINDYLLI